MSEPKKGTKPEPVEVRTMRARLKGLAELEKTKRTNRKLEVNAEGVLKRGFWRTLFPKK